MGEHKSLFAYLTRPGELAEKILKKWRFWRLKKENPFQYRLEMLRYEGARIGDSSLIYPGVDILDEPYLVEIGENVILTGGVKLLTHDGAVLIHREELGEKEIYGRVKIGNNVFVGMHSMILPNVTIGNNVIIGTASVVTRNVPSDSIVMGNPAKVVTKASISKRFMEKNKNLLDRVFLMSDRDAVQMLSSHFNLDKSDFSPSFKHYHLL